MLTDNFKGIICLGKREPRIYKAADLSYTSLVPGVYYFTGSYLFKFQLRSTLGHGAEWYTQNLDDPILYSTWGEYNPIFFGIIEDPTVIWLPHGKETYFTFGKDTPAVVQKFKIGFDTFTAAWGLGGKFKPLPFRKPLFDVMQRADYKDYTVNDYPEIRYSFSAIPIEMFNEMVIYNDTLFNQHLKNIGSYWIIRGRFLQVSKFRINNMLYIVPEALKYDCYLAKSKTVFDPIYIEDGMIIAFDDDDIVSDDSIQSVHYK